MADSTSICISSVSNLNFRKFGLLKSFCFFAFILLFSSNLIETKINGLKQRKIPLIKSDDIKEKEETNFLQSKITKEECIEDYHAPYGEKETFETKSNSIIV